MGDFQVGNHSRDLRSPRRVRGLAVVVVGGGVETLVEEGVSISDETGFRQGADVGAGIIARWGSSDSSSRVIGNAKMRAQFPPAVGVRPLFEEDALGGRDVVAGVGEVVGFFVTVAGCGGRGDGRGSGVGGSHICC